MEKREKQEFREMLNDRNLENVFRQLSQGDILAEKLEEYKQYDARKAFGKFSRQQKIRFVIKRGLSGFLLQQWWFYFSGMVSLNLGLPEVEVVPPAQQETIRPGITQSYITTDKWRDGESRAGFHAGTGKKWDSD